MSDIDPSKIVKIEYHSKNKMSRAQAETHAKSFLPEFDAVVVDAGVVWKIIILNK